MEVEEESVVVGENTANRGTRKRLRRKSKKQQEYEKRYGDKDPDLKKFVSPCKHKEGLFSCNSLSAARLCAAKKKVYAKADKKEQDKRLSFFMSVEKPKRRRVRGSHKKSKGNSISVKYFINSPTRKVRVCEKFFRKVFGVGQRRLNTIAKGVMTGEGVIDERGGDHKLVKFLAKRRSVEEFLSGLKARESHYSRTKSKRLYLPSELNINKLFKLYNNFVDNEKKVKKTFFANIFSSKFNLGFGSPATDVCSYCSRIQHQIKVAIDRNEKQKLMLELGVHKKRAKAFHKIMKEKPSGSISYVFDLQQIQALPKLNISEAYYSRQLSLYAFCITDVKTTDPVFYLWNDTQAGRGAEEVSSAITDFLNKLEISDNITTIRLFADGCGGQNKNQHVVHALAFWLLKASSPQLKNIILYFPVRGHSYLPADRVFGQVEKKIRRVSEIVNPTEYQDIYKDVGKIRILGKDWVVKNYKELSKKMKKTEGITNMKRIILQKVCGNGGQDVKLRMESSYRHDDLSKRLQSVTKRGYKFSRDVEEPHVLPLSGKVTEDKVKDVARLLSLRFGENWRELEKLNFFREFLVSSPNIGVGGDEEELCDCLQEDASLNII